MHGVTSSAQWYASSRQRYALPLRWSTSFARWYAPSRRRYARGARWYASAHRWYASAHRWYASPRWWYASSPRVFTSSPQKTAAANVSALFVYLEFVTDRAKHTFLSGDAARMTRRFEYAHYGSVTHPAGESSDEEITARIERERISNCRSYARLWPAFARVALAQLARRSVPL